MLIVSVLLHILRYNFLLLLGRVNKAERGLARLGNDRSDRRRSFLGRLAGSKVGRLRLLGSLLGGLLRAHGLDGGDTVGHDGGLVAELPDVHLNGRLGPLVRVGVVGKGATLVAVVVAVLLVVLKTSRRVLGTLELFLADSLHGCHILRVQDRLHAEEGLHTGLECTLERKVLWYCQHKEFSR